MDSLKNIKKAQKNKLISKSQQRFRREKHNVFTENVNKIVLSTNDDKRIQTRDSMKIYTYEINKKLTREK